MPKFKTTILTAGKNITGICIPDEIVEKMGAGKKPPVKVTLKGYTYRSTVAVMGGKFMVGVSADVRKASGVSGGDTLIVDIELDTEVREVAVPADLQKALNKDKVAKKNFEALSYSKRKAYVTVIEQAKTEETRARRVEKAVGELGAM